MGHGFNRRGDYVALQETSDPNRKAKFEFKLGYANRHAFPYYVLSYDEFEPIGQDIHLTIRDGIIGQELARAELKERMLQIKPQDLKGVDAQTLVTDLESDAELAHDPIVQKYYQAAAALTKLGCQVRKKSFHDYEYPPLSEPYYDMSHWFLSSVESLRARLEAMQKVREIKCVCTLETSIGEVSDVARMRNVGDIGQTLVIVKNVAELLAYSKALRLVRRRASQSEPG